MCLTSGRMAYKDMEQEIKDYLMPMDECYFEATQALMYMKDPLIRYGYFSDMSMPYIMNVLTNTHRYIGEL